MVHMVNKGMLEYWKVESPPLKIVEGENFLMGLSGEEEGAEAGAGA